MNTYTKIAFGILLLLVSYSANAATFANLENDQAIRSNSGVMVVQVKSNKPFTLLMDRKIVKTIEVPETETTTFVLKDVDRGTHLLQIVYGNKVEQIFVHLLRTHL